MVTTGSDDVASARIAYETCRLRTVGGRHAECIEEKVAFQRAKQRLEFCQNKMEVVRRWTSEAGRQVDEYRGRSGPLQRLLEDELPNTLAKLSRMIEAIEVYASIQSLDSSEASDAGDPGNVVQPLEIQTSANESTGNEQPETHTSED